MIFHLQNSHINPVLLMNIVMKYDSFSSNTSRERVRERKRERAVQVIDRIEKYLCTQNGAVIGFCHQCD